MTKLQTLIFPRIEINAPEEMYFRGEKASDATTFEEIGIRIPKTGKCTLDTYFNAFSVRAWKENTTVEDLSVELRGSGKVRVRVGLHQRGQTPRWLTEKVVTLSGTITNIEIDAWHKLQEGLIYLELLAIEDTHLQEGHFVTASRPQIDVKLGIVVTHFNRKHYVLPAMKRVSEELLSDPEFTDKIELVVVDNSRNIEPHEAGKALVIPNQNLGGSGGFTRGLLHLMDNGFTHCLFMDDDASCEIESIRRTYRLLQFANDQRLAIAGSMLMEDAPNILHEKGATFTDGRYTPLMKGLDLRHVDSILISEGNTGQRIYGGWWHFGFSINNITHYPFPFFVRGDDVLFSILNDFNILTMNGIACWAEDFEIKESPMVRYFSMRGTLGLMLLTSEKGRIRFLKTAWRPTRESLFSYHYESARAFRLAIEHVMRGPHFFSDNLDANDIRQEISNFNKTECLGRYVTQHNLVKKRSKKTLLRRFMSKATLNGFLLPTLFIRDKIVSEKKGYFGSYPTLFRYREALFHVPNTALGYIVKYDKKSFFKEYFRFWQTMWKFSVQFNHLRKEYRDALPEMTSEEFWRGVYDKKY